MSAADHDTTTDAGTWTRWLCEQCDVGGTIFVPDGAGLSEGLQVLREAHERQSPACHFGLKWVRVDVADPEVQWRGRDRITEGP